jgi:hypothetical protein
VGLFDGYRNNRMATAFTAAVDAVIPQIKADGATEDLRRDLVACTVAAGAAIPDFVATARNQSMGEGVDQLIKALDGGADPVPPLRVVMWAYMRSVIRDDYWERRDEILNSAQRSYGIESDPERAVASMEVSKDTRDRPESIVRYDRIVYENLIASVLGEHADPALTGILVWGIVFSHGWDMYHRRACHEFETASADPERA